ncbi:MAG: hypothetical protein AAF628_27000 [Planctomycetota bacterium]
MLAKLLLTPALIVGASLAQRRWGARVAGVLVGLPLTAGPLMLFLALEQGAPFAAIAAAGSLRGLVPLAAFCVVYGRLCPHRGWGWSAIGAAAVFCVVAAALAQVTPPVLASFVLVLAVLGVSVRSMPRAPVAVGPVWAPNWELPLRAGIGTAMVCLLTAAATALGANATGVLAPFPAVSGTLVVFTHRRDGATQARSMLDGVLRGSFAYALFFVVLSWGLGALSLWQAFAAALGSAVAVLLVTRERVSAPRS